MSDDSFIGGIALGVVIGGFVAAMISGCAFQSLKRDAINSGAAHYVMEPSTGAVTFEFKNTKTND